MSARFGRMGLVAFAAAAVMLPAMPTAAATATANSKCSVTDGAKLPASSGGGDALCAAIAQAVAARIGEAPYSVSIDVQSAFRFSARIVSGDGRDLGTRHFVRNDQPMSIQAFERFAASIAETIAKGPTGA